MKKNLLLVSTILALGATSLTACGGGAESDPYKDLDFGVDISGTTISMLTPFGSEMQNQLEALVERWERITGVNVEIESKGSYDTLKSAIVSSASSKTYPNITFAYPDHMASYVGSDIILRLDTYLEKGANTKFDYASNSPEFKADDFYADYMAENKSVEFKEDGSGYILGIPFNKSTEVLTYNKTFFDWAAGENEAIHVPTTWDELDTISTLILNLMKNRGLYGKVLGKDNVVYESHDACVAATQDDEMFDFSEVMDPTTVSMENVTKAFRPLGRDSASNFFITTVRQYGGEYTTVDKSTRKGKILFNSEANRQALQEMQNRYNSNTFGIPATWGENKYCSGPFSALRCVMNIGSSAGADNNAPAGGKFDVSCAPILYKDASRKYVISQGTNLVLLDKGSNAERIASWELLKYLTKYVNGEFSANTGYFPSCDYAFQSDEYQEFFSYRPVSMTDKINLAAAKVNRDLYTAENTDWIKFVDAAFDGSSTVRSTVESAISLLTIGLNGQQQTPTKVLQDLYNELKDYQ